MSRERKIFLLFLLLILVTISMVYQCFYTLILITKPIKVEAAELQTIDPKTIELTNTLEQIKTQCNTQKRELQILSDDLKIFEYVKNLTNWEEKDVSTFMQVQKKYNIPRGKFLGMLEYESEFNPTEKNPSSSARGVAQFLDGTARWVAKERGVKYSPEMLFDVSYSLEHAGWYLNYLYKQTGDWDKAFFRYGDQTKTYVPRIASRGEVHRKAIEKLIQDK